MNATPSTPSAIPSLNRREALLHIATLMGLSTLAPRLLAADAKGKNSTAVPASTTAIAATSGFSAADIALLDEIGETIIPATDIPGARAVQIGVFMATMVADCYEPSEVALVRQGVAALATGFRQQHRTDFIRGAATDRTAFLNELDREQKAYTARKTADQPPHYFRILKELTILGYFSSEIGCTQAVRFIEAPGRYDGAAPYKKGDRAFFS